MALSAGDRLGPYEIIGPIGIGGMGEVFKARDERLARFVALKILHTPTTSDAALRDRFQREARAVAALAHPNIVTIFSIEEHDGSPFLTMELLEGQTLHEMLPRQGASVTTDGHLKVLDFGLAKLTEKPASAGEFTSVATEQLTGQGQILGTVAYMSPEQAEGKALDHRSDIFSLSSSSRQDGNRSQASRTWRCCRRSCATCRRWSARSILRCRARSRASSGDASRRTRRNGFRAASI